MQAALDYKFINDRFCRGKKAIDDFQAKHHSFVNTTSLLLAHPEIVAKAAELGQTTLLGAQDRGSAGKCHCLAIEADHHLGGLHPLAQTHLENYLPSCLQYGSTCSLNLGRGAMSVDEAVSLTQSVTSGNPQCLGFFLMPQWHSSTDKNTVMKNRRLLEDKVAGCLDSSLR